MTDSWKSDEITSAVQMMTGRTCLTSLVMTVKNLNILFIINKSDVHEPVESDTKIVSSKAKKENLSLQS